jgi:CPA1 family monovalent cation:H+ antiporter
MNETITIALAGILLLTLFCQWIAWWVRLPSILFLLVVGLVIGPITGLFNPDEIFKQTLSPFISISVAIILFEGSLSLNYREIKPHLSAVGRLLTLGVFFTSASAAVAVHYLFGVSYQVAILFGVIISVSGPTTITPLLRSIRPTDNVRNILRWEGIIIDPIGALLAVLVFNYIFISLNGGDASDAYTILLGHIVIGVGIGIGLGYAMGLLLRNHLIPEYLQNVATLSLVVLTYAAANHFDEGSGLLGVTLMGITLANMRDVHIDDIIDFKESLSILLISGVFIVLAARISFGSSSSDILWPAVILIILLQFIIRPLNILLCTFGTQLKWREKALLAWIAPRGIVAAAISAVFAFRLADIGVADSHLVVLLTFLVVISTVVIQSLTAPWLAKFLGLSQTNNSGFLIVGANPVARTIAKALEKHGVKTLLVSVIWDNIQAARMDGLQTYYGHPVSEKTDRHLDLVGLDNMLAITARNELNVLACMRYLREFGKEHIYRIQTSNALNTTQPLSIRAKQQILFNGEITFSHLLQLTNRDTEPKHTTLSENFSYEQYLEQHKNSVLLFAVDPKNIIHFYTQDYLPKPNKDWTIVSLSN